MKKTIRTLILLALSLAVCIACFACAKVTFDGFNDETLQAEYSKTYSLNTDSITGSDGVEYQVKANVVNSKGETVEVANDSFKIEDISGYTITYSIVDDAGNVKATRVVKLEVANTTKPTITIADCASFFVKGETFTFPEVTIVDLLGENLQATYKVFKEDGTEVQIQADGKSYLCSEIGDFKLVVTAKNSYGVEGKAEKAFSVLDDKAEDSDKTSFLQTGITENNYELLKFNGQTGTYKSSSAYSLAGSYKGASVAFEPTKNKALELEMPAETLASMDGYLYIWVAMVPNEGYEGYKEQILVEGSTTKYTKNGDGIKFADKDDVLLKSTGEIHGLCNNNTDFILMQGGADCNSNFNRWLCFAVPVEDAVANSNANAGIIKFFVLTDAASDRTYNPKNFTMLIGNIGISTKSDDNYLFKASEAEVIAANPLSTTTSTKTTFTYLSKEQTADLRKDDDSKFVNSVNYNGASVKISAIGGKDIYMNISQADYNKFTNPNSGYTKIKIYWAVENGCVSAGGNEGKTAVISKKAGTPQYQWFCNELTIEQFKQVTYNDPNKGGTNLLYLFRGNFDDNNHLGVSYTSFYIGDIVAE